MGEGVGSGGYWTVRKCVKTSDGSPWAVRFPKMTITSDEDAKQARSMQDNYIACYERVKDLRAMVEVPLMIYKGIVLLL